MERKPGDGAPPPPPDAAAPSTDGKLVIKGAITHEKLLADIEARNPIIANRHKTVKSAARAGDSNL